jgi:3-methylfumaryl-CoA hydratase
MPQGGQRRHSAVRKPAFSQPEAGHDHASERSLRQIGRTTGATAGREQASISIVHVRASTAPDAPTKRPYPAMSSPDNVDLADWIGRTETRLDTMTLAPMTALSATLDRDDPPPQAGDELPPLWHWLYFLPLVPARGIGADGHPLRGGFLPPVALPRRMWAGGRLRFHRALRVGAEVERVSRIASVSAKSGKSGSLVFVTVVHELRDAQGLALQEEQDIVYREAPQPDATPPAPPLAPAGGAFSRELRPDPVLLFRYSALTFNSHRIHYDEPYATQVEGYPGLVVHGPLIATLLLDLVRREQPGRRIASFEFKAVSPLIHPHAFTLHGQPQPDGTLSLWARSHTDALAMSASARLD